MESVTPVEIYQKFTDKDTLFFDKDNKVTNVELKRVGDEYMYNPSVIEFTPSSFTYQAVLQRTGNYVAKHLYDLNIGVIENTTGESFSSSLISIFGNAIQRGICPSNIEVNDGSTNINSLTNKSYSDLDFLFIESSNGTGNISIGDNTISIENIIDTGCNVWLSVASFGSVLKSLESSDNKYTLIKNILYSDSNFSINNYPYCFDSTVENPMFPKSKYEYISIFNNICPILILKKKNSGYIIISEDNFLSYLQDNVKVIYEILMQVYLSSYVHSKTYTSWITDNTVDYYFNTNTAFNKKHPSINLIDIMNNSGIDTTVPYNLSTINCTNAVFSSIDINSNLYFNKDTGLVDITKDTGDVSIYSHNGTILYYKSDSVINIIEDNLIITDNGSYISIDSFKSSSLKFYTDKQDISYDSSKSSYILYVDPNTSSSVVSYFYLIEESKYEDIDNRIKVATITIVKDISYNLYDIRVLGGGDASTIKNYEMIDTGNIYGRPYRLGVTTIIHVPVIYKNKRDIIEQEVNKNIASSEYPIVVFDIQ